VDLLAGYRYAQVFAPKDKDYIALEPMTAPTSALTSGRGLRFVTPGGRFRARFRIRIDRRRMTPPGFAGPTCPLTGSRDRREYLRWVQEKGQKMSRKRYNPEQVIVMHRGTLR
jgi:hypothetical protein